MTRSVRSGTGALTVLAMALLGLVACGSDGGAKVASPATVPVSAHATTTARSTVVLPAPRPGRAARAARVCANRSPARVRKTYINAAVRHADAADQRFLAAVARHGAATSVPLAARIYAMTVPKSSRVDAYVACAHLLSLKESSR